MESWTFGMRILLSLVLLSLPQSTSQAGLYYSKEIQAELPVAWRGYLLDQRALRSIAVTPNDNFPASPLRDQYLDHAQNLQRIAKQRDLKVDELADLGALYIRLGQSEKTLELLRKAQRSFPEDFKIAANLGTAWQIQGDLQEAIRSLKEAVRLAPAKFKPFEEAHLKLVQLRSREGKEITQLDNLFGVKYLSEKGQPEAGKIAAGEKKKLTIESVMIAQQLGLWLPSDGRILWQLGELANAFGDVRTAAAILEGCVGEFGLSIADLRKRRQIYRQAAEEIAKLPDSEHEKYKGDLVTKSSRALMRKLDASLLPAINPEGVNRLPWIVISETTIGKKFQPKFPKYLEDLQGKRIAITGFMQPFSDDGEVATFMLLEYPIGCWFCESPDPTTILFVQLPMGKTISHQRQLLKVVGTLQLNRNDPEDFLYSIQDAKVSQPD